MIMARDKAVRNDFAGCSTGSGDSGFYKNKGYAIDAFEVALDGHGYHFSRGQFVNFDGEEGRRYKDICDDFGAVVGSAVITYYRMPSGRYEFLGYIA